MEPTVRAILSCSLLIAACASTRSSPQPRAAWPTTTPTPQELRVESGGVGLFVRVVGGGEGASTLLALHGGPGYSHDYMEALERLASDRVRVVTFDERGCGRSKTPPDAAFTLDALVSDVDAVRASLNADRVIVLGHSFGGFLAEAYAAAYPRRVRGLVAVSPMPARYDDLAAGEDQARQRRARLVAEGIVPQTAPAPLGDDCRGELQAELPLDFADPRRPIPGPLTATTCSAHTARVTFEALGHFDLRNRLERITSPTLLVYGDADPNLPTAVLVASYLSGTRPVRATIEHSGHYPFYEQPEEFFARVGAFIDALPP